MKKILLIEDDVLLADCYVRWLQPHYRVQVVRDAQTALDALDQEAPQAIILDILLPGANGVQVLHAMRSYDDVEDIPIIVCSNLDLPDFDLAAYGVCAVLDKSLLSPKTFIMAIQKALHETI